MLGEQSRQKLSERAERKRKKSNNAEIFTSGLDTRSVWLHEAACVCLHACKQLHDLQERYFGLFQTVLQHGFGRSFTKRKRSSLSHSRTLTTTAHPSIRAAQETEWKNSLVASRRQDAVRSRSHCACSRIHHPIVCSSICSPASLQEQENDKNGEYVEESADQRSISVTRKEMFGLLLRDMIWFLCIRSDVWLISQWMRLRIV
jgi:hypothetical protein